MSTRDLSVHNPSLSKSKYVILAGKLDWAHDILSHTHRRNSINTVILVVI